MNYVFPAKFVYWYEVPNHRKIKSSLMNDVLDDVRDNGESYCERSGEVWACPIASTFFRDQPLEFVDQNFYEEIVWNPLRKMYEELSPKTGLMPFSKLALNDFWFNYYSPGHFQETHNHRDPNHRSLFSGIYLFDVSKKDTKTVFYDDPDLAAYNNGAPVQFRTDHITEGHVMIFPSEMYHSVLPAVHNRITFAFNIHPIAD